MTDHADTQLTQTGGNGVPTAGAQELSIPKWRFDEINARLREQQQELQMKNELLQRLSSQNQPQQQPQRSRLSPEELGLDPQTFQAASRIAESLIDERLTSVTGQFKQVIGQLGNDLEETRFLQKFPKASGYLQAVREKKMQHFQQTGGGFLDAESAYKMIRFDELEGRGGFAPQAVQQQAPMAQAQVSQQQFMPSQDAAPAQYPNPAATRTNPAATGAATQSARSEEETIEEIEARLNAAMKSGQRM